MKKITPYDACPRNFLIGLCVVDEEVGTREGPAQGSKLYLDGQSIHVPLVCDCSPWKCYVIYTAYSVFPFSLFVFIDWKSKNSPAFLVTKLLCFQWISSKKEYSLSTPGKYFLLIQAINFVASDKSRCYDDCI